jgi:hypothetical protein
LSETEIETVARVAYEAERAYQREKLNYSLPAWCDALVANKAGYIQGVKDRVTNQFDARTEIYDAMVQNRKDRLFNAIVDVLITEV